MTIVFQGHVTKIEQGHQCVNVHVQPEMSACEHEIVLRIPASDAAHWLPGRQVSVTAYALAPPMTPNADITGR